MVSAQRRCSHGKCRREGIRRVDLGDGRRHHVGRHPRYHRLATCDVVSQGRRTRRGHRRRAARWRIRQPQQRQGVFQERVANRDRCAAAERTPHFRLGCDSVAGAAGADRIAILAGVHVRDAGRDRVGGLADLRRRRFSAPPQNPRRDDGASEQAMKMEPANSSRAIAPEDRRRQIEAAIFLIPFTTYFYFYQGADQSIACRFDLLRSMIEKGTLYINDFCGYNTADIITFHGHIYSVKAPGTSYTAFLQWMFFRIALLPMSAAHEPLYWAFITYLTTVFTTGLLISAMCVVMFRFARFLGASEGRAAGIALILGLGTIAFPYATELTGEPVAAVCVFTAFYLLATFGTRPSSWRACAAGLLAGWAVLNDYPVFLVAAAIGIYALFKLRDWKYLAAFSAGAAITVIVMLAYNWGAFGNPFFFSYQAFKAAPTENHQFPEQAVGFVGLTYPKARILWNVLLDPQRGLFFCIPVLLLSIVGGGYFAELKQWRAEFIVTVYSFVVLILFNASYSESIVAWRGGTAPGPRQIVASVPFMVLALTFLPAAYNWLLGAMGALSAAIMLMATSTNPHFPYEYDNPVRDFALQQFMRGVFDSTLFMFRS